MLKGPFQQIEMATTNIMFNTENVLVMLTMLR